MHPISSPSAEGDFYTQRDSSTRRVVTGTMSLAENVTPV